MDQIGRDERIRTSDPHTPSVMRYQAALRPDRPDWAGEAPSAPWRGMQGSPEQSRRTAMAAFRLDRCRRLDLAATDPISGALDRKRVGVGKRVSVRVGLGVRRIIKKKKKQK